MSNWNWTKDLADALTPPVEDDADPSQYLTPLGNTYTLLTNQLAEAYAQPQTWLVKQYIAEAKHRLAKLGAA